MLYRPRASWRCLDCDHEVVASLKRLEHCPKCHSPDMIEKDTCASCLQRFAPDTRVLTHSGKSYAFQFGEWREEEEIEQDRKDNPEFYEEIEEETTKEKKLKRKMDLVMEYDGGEAALHLALDTVIDRLERGLRMNLGDPTR